MPEALPSLKGAFLSKVLAIEVGDDCLRSAMKSSQD